MIQELREIPNLNGHQIPGVEFVSVRKLSDLSLREITAHC